jgi:hypothetical protein
LTPSRTESPARWASLYLESPPGGLPQDDSGAYCGSWRTGSRVSAFASNQREAERSALIRRPSPLLAHALYDLSNLAGVVNNGNHRHTSAAGRTGPHVHFVYPGGRLRTMKARLASSRAQALLRSVRSISRSGEAHAGPPSRASPCPYQPSGARLLRAGRFFQVPRALEAYSP